MYQQQSIPLAIELSRVGASDLPLVGGKGANLGEMLALDLPVPPGFCLTTEAFCRFVEEVPGYRERLARLDQLAPDDLAGVAEHAGEMRRAMHEAAMPEELGNAIKKFVHATDLTGAYAVRSSATLEDLPGASFAGQQDTYLNVVGVDEISNKVRACFASLFTDRAVIYRRRQGYGSQGARLSVVVQRMIPADISGIAFTADPVTQHRGVCAIDASYGLGEALVSGLVNADNYRVDRQSGEVLSRTLGDKAIAIRPVPGGGTRTEDVPDHDRAREALTPAQLTELVRLIDKVEAHYGCPQDLEWCFEGSKLYLVQSRAITSLYPLPEKLRRRAGDRLRVFVSFGHLQVNTVPFPPLTHHFIRRILPVGKPSLRGGLTEDSTIFHAIGGRVFVDATPALTRFPTSKLLPKVLTNMDQTIAGRLQEVCSRPAFHRGPHDRARVYALAIFFLPILWHAQLNLWWRNLDAADRRFERLDRALATTVERARNSHAAGVERLQALISKLSEVFEQQLLAAHPPVVVAGMLAWKILERLVGKRLPPGTVDALNRGFEGNVTTEMDLELGDLADLARGTEIADVLAQYPPNQAIDQLRTRPSAAAFLHQWDHFIARYGHRCPGEIDIAVRRWSEDPSSLVTSIVGMLRGGEPGQHRRREQEARAQAHAAIELIEQEARRGMFGWLRHRLVSRLIKCMRKYLGLREHGKFLMVRAFTAVRMCALECGERGVAQGVFERADDAFLFDFDELREALASDQPEHWQTLVRQRREQMARDAERQPPPVLTNDGEIPPLPVEKDIPSNVLTGQGVSAGVIEGVARVITDPTREVLHAGEVLVAPFTDPGWTPLFVHASGLVMQVGGMMTHGSVVAREYGIPAVVSVEQALQRIKTGDHIRVDGEKGWVTILRGEGE